MTKAERDAWAAAYRLYEEYAPPLRQAATLDDDNDLACKLFTSAVEKVAQPYNESCNEGRLILLGAYGILEEVFKDAQKRHQERVNGEGGGNIHPHAQGAEIARKQP